MFCIFEASCSNQEMGASYLMRSLDHAISITGVMIGLSELFVCEIGCDIKEGKGFLHDLAELL